MRPLHFLILLFFAAGIYACPGFPANNPSTWRTSYDISGGNVYFENLGDNSGYLMCSNVDFSQYYISFHIFEGGISETTIPSPTVLGVQSSSTYTVDGNSITETGTADKILGYPTDTSNNIRSWTTTVSSTQACFGLLGAGTIPSFDTCPILGIMHCTTCVTYTSSCYPCDCSCTTCYGPAPGMCCDPACSSCFGLTSGSCNACNNGYYMQPSTTNCNQCDPACANCTEAGNSSCTSCNPGYYSQPSPLDTTCSKTCPNGFYPNSIDSTCEACSTSCATCNTFGDNSCTSCNNGSYLNGSTCFNVCPQGTFAYALTGTCTVACPAGYKPDHSSNQCLTSLVNISTAQANTLVAAPVVASAAFTISSVASGGFSINMVMFLVASESIGNMQFLNINHSNLALTVYNTLYSSPVPNWIATHNNLDPSLLIFNWGIFQTNQISALYFDNFGGSFTELLIYFGIFLLAALLTIRLKIEKLLHSFAGKIYIATFSYFVANILGHLQRQVLFFILQGLRLNLLTNIYTALSIIVGIATILVPTGLLIFLFLRLKKLYKSNSDNTSGEELAWLEKKYEFLVGDFKKATKKQFFFAHWLAVYDIGYILIIICLEDCTVWQCLSVMQWVLSFIVLSAKIKPFKKRVTAFLYFFNFGCVLAAAFLNFVLACLDAANSNFSHSGPQGWVLVSVIILNITVNIFFSVGGMLFEFYKKIKSWRSKKTREFPVTQTNDIQPPTLPRSLPTLPVGPKRQARTKNPLTASTIYMNEEAPNVSQRDPMSSNMSQRPFVVQNAAFSLNLSLSANIVPTQVVHIIQSPSNDLLSSAKNNIISSPRIELMQSARDNLGISPGNHIVSSPDGNIEQKITLSYD